MANPPTFSKASQVPLGRRVLLADDNRDAADSLATLLRLFGHDVRIAYDGLEAVSVAEDFAPDVAVLDIGMPGLNGYEVADRLRRIPGRSGIGLIALTGWGQPDDRTRALDAGFDHHVTKPVDPGALLQLISALGEAI